MTKVVIDRLIEIGKKLLVDLCYNCWENEMMKQDELLNNKILQQYIFKTNKAKSVNEIGAE